MISVRPGAERGRTQLDWLDSRHSFSFGEYYDPAHMGFRTLRVINEDYIQPSQGFGTHPHRDMEILTYVLNGALEHKDSLGTGSVIRPGDLQRMTAGAGIRHSEFNHSQTELVHLLQIWILPARRGLQPGYEQRSFRIDGLTLVASPDGRNGSLTVHQDAMVYAAKLPARGRCVHQLGTGRHAWLQLAQGAATVNSISVTAGDGVAVSDEQRLEIEATGPTEFLLFDLA